MNRRSFLSFIGLAPIAAVAATNIAASSGVPLSADTVDENFHFLLHRLEDAPPVRPIEIEHTIYWDTRVGIWTKEPPEWIRSVSQGGAS